GTQGQRHVVLPLGPDSRANWHLAQKGAPRRALGRDTSALPLTRWRSSRWPMRRPRHVPIHHVKQLSFFGPGTLLPPGSSPSLFTFVAADPERGDWRSAERRHSLVRVAQ